MDMPVQISIKKEKLYAATVFGCLVYLSTPAMAQRQRELKGTWGRYCAGSVIREKTANSALQCAGECSSDTMCVAYSQRKCLLHADFCTSADLLPEPGSPSTLVSTFVIFACNCLKLIIINCTNGILLAISLLLFINLPILHISDFRNNSQAIEGT